MSLGWPATQTATGHLSRQRRAWQAMAAAVNQAALACLCTAPTRSLHRLSSWTASCLDCRHQQRRAQASLAAEQVLSASSMSAWTARAPAREQPRLQSNSSRYARYLCCSVHGDMTIACDRSVSSMTADPFSRYILTMGYHGVILMPSKCYVTTCDASLRIPFNLPLAHFRLLNCFPIFHSPFLPSCSDHGCIFFVSSKTNTHAP